MHVSDYLDRVLQFACDAYGDITPQVSEHFHARHPDARKAIEERYPGRLAELEGLMVEQALYCIMQWPIDRQEVEFILGTVGPQHASTFGIGTEHFIGFFDSVFAVIRQTIPSHALPESRIFGSLQSELQTSIGIACKAVTRPPLPDRLQAT